MHPLGHWPYTETTCLSKDGRRASLGLGMFTGEPDAGNPHVRFEEGESSGLGNPPPAALYSTGQLLSRSRGPRTTRNTRKGGKMTPSRWGRGRRGRRCLRSKWPCELARAFVGEEEERRFAWKTWKIGCPRLLLDGGGRMWNGLVKDSMEILTKACSLAKGSGRPVAAPPAGVRESPKDARARSAYNRELRDRQATTLRKWAAESGLLLDAASFQRAWVHFGEHGGQENDVFF